MEDSTTTIARCQEGTLALLTASNNFAVPVKVSFCVRPAGAAGADLVREDAERTYPGHSAFFMAAGVFGDLRVGMDVNTRSRASVIVPDGFAVPLFADPEKQDALLDLLKAQAGPDLMMDCCWHDIASQLVKLEKRMGVGCMLAASRWAVRLMLDPEDLDALLDYAEMLAAEPPEQPQEG